MARTTHIVRSSACACCGMIRVTQRCPSCAAAYYCSAACGARHTSHKTACTLIAGALQAAARYLPNDFERQMISDFIAVVDFEMGLPTVVDISSAYAKGGLLNCAEEFLGHRLHALEIIVGWLCAQAPQLLSSPVAADQLLATAIRLRDEGRCAEVALLAWTILERCSSSGAQRFQDALLLHHTSFACMSHKDTQLCTAALECEDFGVNCGDNPYDMLPGTPEQSHEAPLNRPNEPSCSSSGCSHARTYSSVSVQSVSEAERNCVQQHDGQHSCSQPYQLTDLPLVSARASAVLNTLSPLSLTVYEDRNPFLLPPLLADLSALGLCPV